MQIYERIGFILSTNAQLMQHAKPDLIYSVVVIAKKTGFKLFNTNDPKYNHPLARDPVCKIFARKIA